MGKFQARAVGKGDYDGIRKQIVEVLEQPGYDDGEWQSSPSTWEDTADGYLFGIRVGRTCTREVSLEW